MMQSVAHRIIQWYLKHKRDLPWRNTTDPYQIWLSEIILQQTRVDQGLPYFLKFMSAFPTVGDLAKAPLDQVLKLWQGLGYYSRARNLHAAAISILKEHKGKFPVNYDEVLKLKGVGTYTAAAIVSFAYKQPYPVLDGNVYRVLSRYFGVLSPIDSGKAKKEFLDLAKELIDAKQPDVFNQAIMEFGALQCKPQTPDCRQCVLNDSCWAFAHKKVDSLPVKSKTIAIKQRFFEYIVLDQKGSTVLSQRKAKDIWQGLYEFPLIESFASLSEKEIMKDAAFKSFADCGSADLISVSPVYKHVLSHQHIFARFWHISIKKGKLPSADKYLVVKWERIGEYAVSRLTDRFLEVHLSRQRPVLKQK